ncbi:MULTISPECIES: hypothetical protein [Pseudomonas]|uniref:Uncharacterized protein n=1 Tax=Pseudomonas hunanensis TaxID=1247546 RepID=A0ACC6JWB8_9PSED|nr:MULTISPECIES: hypothetical protein [Pseudomonas]MBP2259859.1 hypothetical protein [Pseudomonas sp. BP8]MDR6710486.1 hypothetical protein [Pseudomonas hunanensis]HDS1737089.1 hypothetical protein [Pseudomonas putida]
MKKIVPDPPLTPPVSYFSIISGLAGEDALAASGTLMDLLNRNLESYLCSEQVDVGDFRLENAQILSQMLCVLVAHARAEKALRT